MRSMTGRASPDNNHGTVLCNLAWVGVLLPPALVQSVTQHPDITATLLHAVLDEAGQAREILNVTCFRVEAGTVPGADDSVGSEGALDKRSSVMGTLSTKSAHYSILPYQENFGAH